MALLTFYLKNSRQLWLGCGLLAVMHATPADTYTLAVVPQLAPAEMHRSWAPFANRLGKETGYTIQLRVYRTFDEFETEFLNGVPDLIYVNPYHQLVAHKTHRYIPLVRDDAQKLAGVLVVARDSPIQSVKELDGKVVGFPDPNAFAASLYIRALLQEKEKIRFTPHFYGSHGNVYRHVIVGDVVAGGGVNNTLAREHPETRHALRVLYETPGVPAHPLSAHPRLAPATREAIINVILRLGQEEDGRKLLKRIQIPQPVRANHQRDYLPLEKLQLQRYAIVTDLPVR